MALTPYGRRELAIASVLTATLAAAVALAAWLWCWGILILLAIPASAEAFVLWFFRDPPRTAPEGEGVFVSPADGRVTDITPLGPEGPLGTDGVKIGIFMSVFSVHVNRCPESARVVSVEHRAGTFLDARDREASERNESATVTLATEVGGIEHRWMIRQVAGLIARRIVTDLSVGQSLARGQRIGMIKFGSRMELLVGRELASEVLVRIGQTVRAGATPLIRRPRDLAGAGVPRSPAPPGLSAHAEADQGSST
jgi:phosphatidylserine decarboxylase